MADTPDLPELPESSDRWSEPSYTADQMRAYAREAVRLAARASVPAKPDGFIHDDGYWTSHPTHNLLLNFGKKPFYLAAPTPPDEASDALDAARYRKLRDAGRCDSKHGTGISVGDRLTARVAFRYWCAPEELDAAIDAIKDAS